MNRREKVHAILDHVAESLDGLEKPVLQIVMPALNQAHHELEGSLRSWLARQDGRATFTAQRYRNALLHVRYAIDKIEASGIVLEHGLKRSLSTIGPLSVRNLEWEFKSFASVFGDSAQPIALDEAIIVSRGKKLLWKRFESSAGKYAGTVGARAQRELAVGMIRSETMDELTTRLSTRLPKVFRSNRWDAERLVRTETMNAYNVYHEEGIVEASKEDPQMSRRWDATYDFRRCPMCASIDGQVVKVGEKFRAEWTTYSRRGGVRHHAMDVDTSPAHPCCRCVVCAWRNSWASYSRHGMMVHPTREYREAA